MFSASIIILPVSIGSLSGPDNSDIFMYLSWEKVELPTYQLYEVMVQCTISFLPESREPIRTSKQTDCRL